MVPGFHTGSPTVLACQVTTDFRGHQTIPAEFPQILKDFTREILREQPDNLYRFGRDYFERLAYPDAVGDASGDDSRRPFESMSDEELLAWLTEIFVTADTDNNGSLDREEFKVVMSGLNLTPAEAMQVCSRSGRRRKWHARI